jgi:hypothetical protein
MIVEDAPVLPSQMPTEDLDLSWIDNAEPDWQRWNVSLKCGGRIYEADAAGLHRINRHLINFKSAGWALAIAELFSIEDDPADPSTIYILHRDQKETGFIYKDGKLFYYVDGQIGQPYQDVQAELAKEHNDNITAAIQRVMSAPDMKKYMADNPKDAGAFRFQDYIRAQQVEHPVMLAIEVGLRDGAYIPLDKRSENYERFISSTVIGSYRAWLHYYSTCDWSRHA